MDEGLRWIYLIKVLHNLNQALIKLETKKSIILIVLYFHHYIYYYVIGLEDSKAKLLNIISITRQGSPVDRRPSTAEAP